VKFAIVNRWYLPILKRHVLSALQSQNEGRKAYLPQKTEMGLSEMRGGQDGTGSSSKMKPKLLFGRSST
jgi:hypothetical protein